MNQTQEFEKYPKLTDHIQGFASFGQFGSWSEFLAELNKALKEAEEKGISNERERNFKAVHGNAKVCERCNRPIHVHPHDFYDNSLDCNYEGLSAINETSA